jgi:glucose-1-phosphate adenylyltransferase
MVGVVVGGGTSESLAPLGVPADVAFAPFAARYRLGDFARTTLRNSGLRVLDGTGGRAAPRPGARLLPALRACAGSAPYEPSTLVVVLVADHILDADLRPVLSHPEADGIDLALLCLPDDGSSGGCRLAVDASGTVRVEPADGPAEPHGALNWTGDLVVRAGSLPGLLSTAADEPGEDDATLVSALVRRHRVVARDLATGAAGARRPYWHEPSSVEAYYAAHMELCTDAPGLDLYDPTWPLVGASEGLPPAKVVSGASSHPGQALNALLGEGAVIRGGSVIRCVVGRGALVDVGAEVEDSLLLDGCRIGRCARVRRALVCAGAVIPDGEQVGYDDEVAVATTRRLASGLTLVLAEPETQRSA